VISPTISSPRLTFSGSCSRTPSPARSSRPRCRRAGTTGEETERDIPFLKGYIEAIIARDGAIMTGRREVRRLYFMRVRRGLPFSTLIDDLHGRHHLLARDLSALLVLLSLDTGLEPECLKTLNVDCLANAHAGAALSEATRPRCRAQDHARARWRDRHAGRSHPPPD
jgi:hypothetical protein